MSHRPLIWYSQLTETDPRGSHSGIRHGLAEEACISFTVAGTNIRLSIFRSQYSDMIRNCNSIIAVDLAI